MKKNSSRVWPCAWVAVTIWVLIPTALAADQPAQFAVPESQIQALGIQTAPLQAQTDSVRASFPAKVVVPAKAEQVVSSPVAGLVTQLLVQKNQVVRRNTSLVSISSPELGQLQLQFLQAAARATLARQTSQREQALFNDGIIPQRRIQESQAALKEAEATLNHAKAALRLSGMTAATIERVAASGKLQDSITLTALQAGIVTEIEIRPGQRVETATALMRIAQTDSLWLEIELPVSESRNWPAGTKIKVPGRDISARILSVSPTVSSSSQTTVLRAAIEGRVGEARPGEFVTVELPLAVAGSSWDVPLSALAHDGKQAYLFVRTSNGFEARPVTVAASAGQRVRVQGALSTGEQIAISGVVVLKGAWLNAKETK